MAKKREQRGVDVVGVPIDYGANRRGVGVGPAAFRLAALEEKLMAEGIDVRDLGDVPLPPPRKRGRNDHSIAEIKAVCAELSKRVHASLRRGRLPVVIGGDHSIAIGTLAGASRYHREKSLRMGLVWVDAHGDMNNPSTSPSGNIHGMPLAVSLGDGVPDLVRLEGFHPKVEAARTALVGIRNLDDKERQNIARFGINVYTMKDIDRRGISNVMDEAIHVASKGAAGVHVSFDMDAVDPQAAPGVGTGVPGGLSYREAHLVMELIHDAGIMTSLEVVETNPFLDVRNATARLGVELILSALGKSIY
ncbi:MAG TPA: arginase [Planctomycetota bacterium]|nr:arginase [Planctomycetota bacterium]